MAGWTTVPVANEDAILDDNFDEVRAAILERATAAGQSLTVTDVSTDGDQAAAVRTNYRSNIEALIPYFANPAAGYAAYNKETCLTAAIGAADWTAAGDTYMYTEQLNEMQDVLNLLIWAIIIPLGANCNTSEDTGTGSSAASYADAWTTCKVSYPTTTAYPGELRESDVWGYQNTGYAGWFSTTGFDGTYYKDIVNRSVSRLRFVVPAGTIADTKLYNPGVWQFSSSTIGVKLFEQASFAGTEHELSTGAEAIDVATVTAGNVDYSLRSNPAEPDQDTNEAGPGAIKGAAAVDLALLVQYTFTYKA